MTATGLMWAAAVGIAAGGAHAAALWRATHRIGDSGYGAGVRMLLVAAVLVGAAYVGALLPVAAAWACGLLASSVQYVRNRRWGM
jgi:NhaP-type Na+/H+ or K+/H+ antiporter